MILIPFCPNCGKNIEAGKKFCETGGTPIAPVPAAAPAVSLYSAAQTSPAPPVLQKNAVLAAIASFFVSGLGQVYNGNFVKGILFFFGMVIGSFILLIPGLIIWVYGIYDAYTTAKKMNTGQIPFVPHSILQIIGFIILVIVICVIIFFLLAAMFTPVLMSSGFTPTG